MYRFVLCQSCYCRTNLCRDDGIIFDDKGDFEEAIADNFCDLEPYKSMPDDEFQKALDREMAKYADKWKKVIAVYVGN